MTELPETNNLFEEQQLYPGQTSYFKCLTSSGPSDLSKYNIQWFKDDVPLTIDSTRMVLFPSGAIEIDELVVSDKGAYQCNVTSGTLYTYVLSQIYEYCIRSSDSYELLSNCYQYHRCSVQRYTSKQRFKYITFYFLFSFYSSSYRHSSKTNLNIKAGGEPQTFQNPSFLTESTSKTVNEGGTVVLECVANGNPKPQIKWLRNGEDIEIGDSESSRFRMIGTGSLQIRQIAETDAGNYQCRASNSMDSADIEYLLMVQVPPKFVHMPTDRIAYEKDELEMVCTIRGKPTPIVSCSLNFPCCKEIAEFCEIIFVSCS